MESLQSALEKFQTGKSSLQEYHHFVARILTLLTTLYAHQHTKKPGEFMDRARDFLGRLLAEHCGNMVEGGHE
jgi:hypothetical protein